MSRRTAAAAKVAKAAKTTGGDGSEADDGSEAGDRGDEDEGGEDDGEEDEDDDEHVDNAGADVLIDASWADEEHPVMREHNERTLRRLMPNYRPRGPMSCELCGDLFRTPVSYHMLTTHPGCGHSSGGRGYTSNGTYKTGWSGACGEGGIAWYLLCEACRGNYMRRAGADPDAGAAGPVRSRKTAAVARRACAAAAAAAADDDRRLQRGESDERVYEGTVRFFFTFI